METITLGQLLEAVGGTLLGEFQDREALIQRVDNRSAMGLKSYAPSPHFVK